ncbi:hypothetical protein GGI05_006310, partial [Coemansia sp. RSA 2603]
AMLVKDARYASEDNVAAVERAFREINVAHKTGASGGLRVGAKYASMSADDLVADITAAAGEGKLGAGMIEAVGALKLRILQQKQVLEAHQLSQLLDVFHSIITDTSESSEEAAKALADCVSSSANLTADTKDKKATLDGVSGKLLHLWKTNENNGQFKQYACRFGAEMYASIAFALAKNNSVSGESSEATDHCEVYALFIKQVWLVGTLPVATSDEVRGVVQGALRLLTADRPMFVHQLVTSTPSFVRLLELLGQKTQETERSLALMFASQLLTAVSDPLNSQRFPGFDAKAARTTSAQQKAPTPALLQTRALTERTLDTWIQSTMQAERSRGLRALAGLYEANVGAEISANLWIKDAWVEELWDQGEFDKPETQLALLYLADVSSVDAKISGMMKKAGNGLVQELVRKGKNCKGGSVEAELADAAAVVLAKWTGVSATPAVSARTSAPDASAEASGIVELPDTDTVAEDADPIALADMHARRIIELASQKASDTNASAMQRAAEALGYLCLKP